MGQKSSCISGSEDIAGQKNCTGRMNVEELNGDSRHADQPRKEVKPVPAPYRITKTAATEYSPDWREGEKDKDCGYNLVDLKGDKIDHTDTITLIGCEIYAPGVGIGLIQTAVGQTKYNILYKIQMADGRSIVAAVRRCAAGNNATVTNLHPRIFIMQRLY